VGIAALLLAILAVAYSGGAAAAVGDTDLSITKTDSPDPVTQGNNLTYTITVNNVGANDAGSVVVTDNLPSSSDIDFVSATSGSGSCQHTGNTVTCDLGQVNAGHNAVVTIVVKAKKSGTLSNTATVASPNDTNATNNSAKADTTVNKPGKGGKKKGKASCGTPTIAGTAGNDVINGTSGADVIVTYAGNDQVSAGGGKDLVCTGDGADVVFGASGGDTVIGGGGKDRLVGQDGGDLLKGKNGRDRLKGNAGNDTLNGGKKRDRCKGGPGADTLIKCP
jgi:uncharacterized repeat protein (TIGR01451 family)